MSKFVFHQRFNKNHANDGVEFEIYDEIGNDWGTFKCLLIDSNNPRFVAAAERGARKLKAAERAAGKNEKLQLKLSIETALDTWLIDWKVNGSDGKAIPFTRDNVLEYLGASVKDEDTGKLMFPAAWVFLKIGELARDPLNFQPDDQEELPEKN